MVLSALQIRDILREKIPANLVVAEHTETGHFYRHTPSNQLFASVTTKSGILDAPHLKKWAAKLAVEHLIQKIQLLPVENRTLPNMVSYQAEAILVHQDQFEEAGDVGTRGHKVVEDYLLQWMKTGVRPLDIRKFITENDPRLYAISRSAEMFCKDFHVIPIVSEMFVCSPRYKFAGTLDSLMMVLNVKEKGDDSCARQLNIEGGQGREHELWQASTSNPNKVRCVHCGLSGEYEFAIVDWKTSNSIDKVEYAMQVSAYWQALFEMTGLRPKRMYIVRLDKSQAKYEVRTIVNRSASFKAFVNTAKVYDWLNDGAEKLVSINKKERVSIGDLNFNPV